MKEIYEIQEGWKFRIERKKTETAIDDYFDMYRQDSKTGVSADERGSAFFDNDWQTVALPHDWCSFEAADSGDRDSGQGYKPQGVVWYRKHITLTDAFDNKRVFLKFDAIAIQSVIWFNGIKVAESSSGYVPVTVEVTDFLEIGKQNCISVRVDNTVKEGWWYEGGGLCGKAYLIATEKSRFRDDGIYVFGDKQPNGRWKVTVRAEVEPDSADGSLFLEAGCEELGISGGKPAGEYNELTFETNIGQVWDIESPKRYSFRVRLRKDGKVIEEAVIRTGFRTVEFDPERGCFLNGRHIKLKGVCIHHDFAGVGIALTDDIQRYRVRRLKEMGCNAIRCAHNPHQASLYRACDELGVLVLDEARHFSSTAERMEQLETFIRRDRNHPSVIAWSLFNEEPLQCTITGEKMFRKMKALVNRLDGTRPVSGAMNGPMESQGVIKAMDMMGFNYIPYEYDEFHGAYPRMPIWGSENSSYMTTRGVTEKEENRRRCFTDYPGENLYQWSANIGDTWKMVDERDFVMGAMDWTGFDYRGECGPYPSTVSSFGAMDLCGFPKDSYYWHQVIWKEEKQVHLSPRWNGIAGERTAFACYSNCDHVVIRINGEIVHDGPHSKYDRILVDTIYRPGTVIAEGYVNGIPAAKEEMKSYGDPFALKITAESESIVSVSVVDRQGNRVEDADDEVTFRAEGGVVLGVGNGDNCFVNAERADRVKLFYGRALAVVNGARETVRVTVSAPGLESDSCLLRKEIKDSRELPKEKLKVYVPVWRQSDVQETYIEARHISDLMFAWIPTTVGYGKNMLYSGKTGFSEVCGQLPVGENRENGSVTLVFEKIDGSADIYLNRDFVVGVQDEKNIRIPIDGKKYVNPVVSVVFKLSGGDCGISGKVYLEVGEAFCRSSRPG